MVKTMPIRPSAILASLAGGETAGSGSTRLSEPHWR